MDNSLRYIGLAEKDNINKGKRIKNIKVRFVANDCTGTFKVTDFMLQAGRTLTGWVCETREMLLRKRDGEGVIEPPKHFNSVLRGENLIVVPNGGNVTSGLDIELTAQKPTTGPITLDTYYGTRTYTFGGQLNAGDTLKLDAKTNHTLVNGQPVASSNVGGAPLTSPAGDSIYKVSLTGQDVGTCLFKVTEWNKSGVNW